MKKGRKHQTDPPEDFNTTSNDGCDPETSERKQAGVKEENGNFDYCDGATEEHLGGFICLSICEPIANIRLETTCLDDGGYLIKCKGDHMLSSAGFDGLLDHLVISFGT